MKRSYSGFLLLLVAALPLIVNCSGRKNLNVKADETAVIEVPRPGPETELLLKDLEQNGDYVNSQNFPSLIKASIVNEELAGNNLIIDLRTEVKYSDGHIKGAVNKQFTEIPEFFEVGIKPFEYDKIILVCDDGQVSSYTASLLRLMGYGNVYAMRWGMGGWNKSYAEKEWLANVSGKFEQKLDTATSNMPLPSGMPELKTGKSTGKEVGDERFKTLFREGIGNITISAEELFADPSSYFVINLERKDKYGDGHIPGAVRYKPDATLGFVDVMSTIPYNKTVVVYCGTGHNSAFATAFLRLFGYDAKTLKFGNNSFMYDRMVKQKAALSWLPFTSADAGDFQVVR